MVVESLTNGPPAKRLFVGLQIYGEPAVKLAAMSKVMSVQFSGAGGQWRLWQPDGTAHRHPPDCVGLDTVPYHITLRFLGPVDVSQVPALKAALTGVATTQPPFVLRLHGCSTFPEYGGWMPKIAWVGVGGESHQLNLLETAVSKAMDGLGYESPGTQYLPHVTVGRFDTNDRDWCHQMSDYWRNMLPLPTKAFLVDEVVLYASERDDDGRVAYVIQGRWPLNADLLGVETSGPSA